MLALLLSAMLAQAPDPLVLPVYRLHLVVDEAIDPDRLRDFDGPWRGGQVVLWVLTTSNSVRDSLAENLRRFPEVHITLRSPLSGDAIRWFTHAVPRAHAWVGRDVLEHPADVALLKGRRVSIQLQGELTEPLFAAAQRLRPERTLWRPGPQVSVLEWTLFRQLPGRRWVSALDGARACVDGGGGREPAPWSSRLKNEPGTPAFPCGRGGRVQVDAGVSDQALRRLYARDPAVELELRVGDDDSAANGAVDLLGRLEAATTRKP